MDTCQLLVDENKKRKILKEIQKLEGASPRRKILDNLSTENVGSRGRSSKTEKFFCKSNFSPRKNVISYGQRMQDARGAETKESVVRECKTEAERSSWNQVKEQA